MHLSEILTHLGEDRENYFHAVSPPIIQASNFTFPNLADFRKKFGNELDNHIYSRGNNPTVQILRKKVAALEGAEDALVFSSGAGAMNTAILANVKTGDHIICVDAPYSWTNTMIAKFLPRFGVTYTFVDATKIENIAAAIQSNTTLLVLESPNSLTFEMQDLSACAQLAKQHGIITVIDNSYCSPLYQKPIEHGIDIVMHTGTKYLNGHSDVVCGVICASKGMIRKIFDLEYMTFGNILSPNDAAMVIRGMRTLPMRLKHSHESAMKITQWLEGHPKVEKVLFPFLPSFPQYELAKRQMQGCGGLFTIYLKTDSRRKVEDFFHQLQRFLLAVSWGGHESLVLPMAAFYDIPGREDTTAPWNLIRFYVGLEDADWLIEDLKQALAIL
jgi:cystathionine beta-lyase